MYSSTVIEHRAGVVLSNPSGLFSVWQVIEHRAEAYRRLLEKFKVCLCNLQCTAFTIINLEVPSTTINAVKVQCTALALTLPTTVLLRPSNAV